MKKVLLTALLMSVASLFAQKKITDISKKYFSEIGDFDYADSTHFEYATFFGSVYSNEPWFGLFPGEVVPLWNWDGDVDPNFTTSEHWEGSSYPLNLDHTTSKSYNQSNQCISHDFSGYRRVFTYNAAGKITSETAESENMGIWEYQNSIEYEYDAANRLVVRNEFNNQMGSTIHVTSDSIEYEGASQDVSRAIVYQSTDGTTFYPLMESNVLFTNGKMEALEYYEDVDEDPLTPLEYLFFGDYVYTGNSLTALNVFETDQGAPTQVIVGQFVYEYNNQGQLTKQIATGFDDEIVTFDYDMENFVDNITYEYETADELSFYVAQVDQFYYQNTANLNEQAVIEFTVYPNPASEILTISATTAIEKITLFNNNGQLVIEQKGINNVDVSKLPAGLYHIMVSSSEGTQFKKVVVQ